MRAVLLVAKGEARRRGLALLGLTLIVGLVGAAVFSSVAAARRTASAPDRLREATSARDGLRAARAHPADTLRTE